MSERYEGAHKFNQHSDHLQLDPGGVCVYSLKVAYGHCVV